MKNASKIVGSLLGGLFMLLGLSGYSGPASAAIGPPTIDQITNKTPLYLTPPQTAIGDAQVLSWHTSHSSHGSHGSHGSHESHSSHRSGW